MPALSRRVGCGFTSVEFQDAVGVTNRGAFAPKDQSHGVAGAVGYSGGTNGAVTGATRLASSGASFRRAAVYGPSASPRAGASGRTGCLLCAPL